MMVQLAIRSFYILLLLLGRSVSAQHEMYNPDLVELLGQSNADGTVSTSFLSFELSGKVDGAYIYTPLTNSWQVLEAGVNNRAEGGKAFGIEMRLMKLLYDKYKRNQYLLKYAVNGTQLAKSDSEIDWSPASSGEYYDRTLDLYKSAVTSLSDKRPPKAVIWIQGENDANALNANTYGGNLVAFITRKRMDYDYPVPFIIVSLSDNQTRLNSAYRNLVKAAQVSVTENLISCYLVQTDELNMNGDGIHYDAHALNTIANKVYDQLINIQSPPILSAEQSNEIKIVYPNPVLSSVTINHQRIIKDGLIEVVSVNGTKLLQIIPGLGSIQTTVDLSVLPPNKYLLQLSNNKKKHLIHIIKH